MNKKIKILIVDDEKMARDSLKGQLESFGYHNIITAAEGERALQIIREDKVHVVFVDIHMPEISGLELMERAKSIRRKVIFIIFSGYDRFEYAQQSIELGAFKYLLKPISDEKLAETLKAVETQIKLRDEEVSRIKELSITANKGQELFRKQYIYDLILGNPGTNKWTGYQSRGQIRFSYDKFKVCMFSVTESMQGYEKKAGNIDYELINFSIENIYSELMGCYQGDYYFFHDGKYLGVLQNYENDLGDNKGIYEEIFEQIRQFLRGFGHVEITFGIGEAAAGMDKIEKAYQSAMEALKNRLFYGEGKLFFAKERDMDKYSQKDEEERLIEDILLHLYQQDRTELREVVNALYRPYRKDGKDISKLNRMHLNIFVLLHKELEKQGIDSTLYLEDEFLLYNKIQKLDTLKEMEDFLFSNAIKCMEALGREAKGGNHIALIRAKNYIKDNLGFELTLEKVAEYINLSPAYFSKIFKEAEGLTFIEHVTNLRIKTAKEMLDQNHKVTDICQKIGYADVKHFYKLFKKIEGITPGDYKRRDLK